MLEYNAIILRYHEIGLKGKNRVFFENVFLRNLKRIVGNVKELEFLREKGRIVAHLPEKIPFSKKQNEDMTKSLVRVFGLESFSFAFLVEPSMEQIKKTVFASFPSVYSNFEEKTKTKASPSIPYRMRVRKSIKNFPKTSQEIEIEFAEVLLEKYSLLKIDLKNAELSIGVEIRKHFALVFYNSIKGPGGLPVGTAKPVLALLSGGIDSPVACYMTMKRGCSVNFITFHSHPYTPLNVLDKIAKLVNHLNLYQKPRFFLACNLAYAQKSIRDNCNSRYRTILYRRMMMRISSALANLRHAMCLITGESLGQVASQTLENMIVINEASSKLIIRPLVGMDKQETIKWAEKIGTIDISNVQVPDSCTVFAPDHPVTASTQKNILREEDKLDIDDLLSKSLEMTVLIDPKTMNEYKL